MLVSGPCRHISLSESRLNINSEGPINYHGCVSIWNPGALNLRLHVFWSRLLEQLRIMFVSAFLSTLPFIFGNVFPQIITPGIV